MADVLRLPSASEVEARYKRGAAGAGQSYREGISRVSDWKVSATSSAAKAAYEAGIQRAIAEDRRGKGLERVSESEWKSRALDVGASNIGSKMASSSGKFARGYDENVRAKLDGLSLPPRDPNNWEANYERSKAVGRALRK